MKQKILLTLAFLGCLAVVGDERHFGFDESTAHIIGYLAFIIFILLIISYTRKRK